MVTPIIIGGTAATLVLVFGLILVRRHNRNADAAQQSGLVEAKKNTLRTELHDLDLGIKQVQRYIVALKPDVQNVESVRSEAQVELDKAVALKTQIEAAIDNATTDAQVDGFAIGIAEARRQVQKARVIASLNQANDDEDDD